MKKNFISLLALFLLSSFSFASLSSAQDQSRPAPAPAPKALWTLEGKTLADFDGFLEGGTKLEDTYKIEDGILKVSGTPFGWLSPKDLKCKNFVLHFDVRYPTENPKVNSGIFIRLNDDPNRPDPKFLPPCIECQLENQNIGHLFGFHGFTLVGASDRYIYRSPDTGKTELHRVNHARNLQKEGTEAWNRVAIICYEDMITVFVNGRPANWVCNAQNQEGKIGFQSEGGEIWFRNIAIFEMPKE